MDSREAKMVQLILMVLVVTLKGAEAQAFPHPSVTNTRSQLLVMKDKALDQPESIPRAGWTQMLATAGARLDYQHQPFDTVEWVPAGQSRSEDAMRRDGHAARAHALQWVVTGNVSHRDKALRIVNDWARTFKGWKSNTSQPWLECAWLLPIWISAADILRYFEPGSQAWRAADILAFDVFAKRLYDQAYQAGTRTTTGEYPPTWPCLPMPPTGMTRPSSNPPWPWPSPGWT